MRATFAAVCLTALFVPAARAAEDRFFDDATLRSVHFADAKQGWAVGDEGVIWRTLDGGKSWDRQASGVRASLRSVRFLSPTVGWVVGREELASGGATGVVLHTRDGGLSWKRLMVNSVPGLHLVTFADDKTGYMAGDGSDQFPSGLFATTDGGRNWAPVPGPRATSWRAGDADAEGAALAGAWNRIATVRRGRLFSVDMDALAGRAITGVQLRGGDAFAVGQGGLVLASKKTRGSSWDYVDMKLPAGVREMIDLHCVGGVGDHVWAAGRPGSVLLHSPDRGTTWELVKTGQSLPLHAVTFRDEKNGVAVGELGTVLVTADGGKTWGRVKGGGKRLAVLALHARPNGAAMDVFATTGADEGHLVGSVCLTAPEFTTAGLNRVGDGCRFDAACRLAGAACGDMLWAFPVGSHLADRAGVLAAWDKTHGGTAAAQMLAQFVLAIRMYRPDVVVTDDAATGVLEAIAAEAAKEAFNRARDENALPAQLTALGLTSHVAKKLYALAPESADVPVKTDTAGLRARLRTTPREFATPAAALVGSPTIPATRSLKLIDAALHGSSAHKDAMQGFVSAVGDSRRDLGPVEEIDAEAIKAVRKRANLWAMADTPAEKLVAPERMLAQIGPTLDGMPIDAAARTAHGLARQYAKRGQWTLAAETFRLLCDRYPTHPLAVDGYRWLLLHQASGEARRRNELGQFVLLARATAGTPGAAAPPVGDDTSMRPRMPKLPEVPSFGHKTEHVALPATGLAEARRWYEDCLGLEKKLAASGPLQATDPSVQFATMAARRQLGDAAGPLAFYRELVSRGADGPWKQAALSELWLMNRTGPAPRPTLSMKAVETRPHLDGKLDDACWSSAKPVKLQNAAGETSASHATEVRMTYDRDYLYVAVKCSHPDGTAVPEAKTRTRDQDLRPYDRVSLMLDIDRDYNTAYHLRIDARGCVGDDCWGDASWNPKWFAAVHRESTAWTAEIAIPRVCLTGDHFLPGKAWAANVVRTIPGKGVQAFSLPAEAPEEATRPEGMGLLIFASERERAEVKPR